MSNQGETQGQPVEPTHPIEEEQGNKPDTPPGQENDESEPGRSEDAPGHNKPEPDQGLPEAEPPAPEPTTPA